MLKVGIEKWRGLATSRLKSDQIFRRFILYTVGEIMKLYYVDEDYINELRNVDERVLLNKSTCP